MTQLEEPEFSVLFPDLTDLNFNAPDIQLFLSQLLHNVHI